MNKKIIIGFFIALILIVSVGTISAIDDIEEIADSSEIDNAPIEKTELKSTENDVLKDGESVIQIHKIWEGSTRHTSQLTFTIYDENGNTVDTIESDGFSAQDCLVSISVSSDIHDKLYSGEYTIVENGQLEFEKLSEGYDEQMDAFAFVNYAIITDEPDAPEPPIPPEPPETPNPNPVVPNETQKTQDNTTPTDKTTKDNETNTADNTNKTTKNNETNPADNTNKTSKNNETNSTPVKEQPKKPVDTKNTGNPIAMLLVMIGAVGAGQILHRKD